MRFTIIVQADPLRSQAAQSAYEFANAAHRLGYKLETIFFYGSGTYVASALTVTPQDETSLHCNWAALAAAANTKLVVCIAAGLKRGLLDENEASRYGKLHHNVVSPFELGGLGQLIESLSLSDRSITFGE